MMSGRFSPKSSTSSSSSSLTPDKDNEREVWTTEGQGPLMHVCCPRPPVHNQPHKSIVDYQWLLFDLSSKYDPESLHRKLDGLVFRVLSLPSATVCTSPSSPRSEIFISGLKLLAPNDRDAIVLLRKEPQDRQYLLCVGREEPWQSVWPEDRIMTAIQNAGLATGESDWPHQ
jgi:hypothetical protein